MSFTYTERKELNALSKEVFGKESLWYNRVYKKGVKDKETKELRYYSTFDDIKAFLLKVKDNTHKMLAELKANAINVNPK